MVPGRHQQPRQRALTFPAHFQLIAAMNPCPCEFYSDTQKACTCVPAVVTKYQKLISGPLLDRTDIHIEVARVDYEKLSGERLGEASAVIRTRVQTARDRQRSVSQNWIPSIAFSVMQICVSGRLGSFADYRTRVSA
jgi:predicted ATPase with chaperone activity